MANSRVTVAEIKKDICYLQKHQEELKTDIKEVKNILINGSSKIATNRESIVMLKWVFGSIAVIITIVAAFT